MLTIDRFTKSKLLRVIEELGEEFALTRDEIEIVIYLCLGYKQQEIYKNPDTEFNNWKYIQLKTSLWNKLKYELDLDGYFSAHVVVSVVLNEYIKRSSKKRY